MVQRSVGHEFVSIPYRNNFYLVTMFLDTGEEEGYQFLIGIISTFYATSVPYGEGSINSL